MKKFTQKVGDAFKATPHPAENIKPTLQNSQSQTPKLMSASDEIVKTFSKMNDIKISLKLYEMLKVNFHEKVKKSSL